MANEKYLIVVLGMHRSGTSVITCGLQVLGVSLGERLMPAIENINARGFWEDIDLNSLNIEMLKAIGSDWFYLAPINAGDINKLHKEGYFLRAVELLREKVCDVPIFGFKDPRVAKLLPFWKEVFDHCQLNVKYVLAMRHPLSVVRSLAKRDGFVEEHSYLLWLGHTLESWAGSAGKPRVLVDYDRMMQSPDAELMRMAKALSLKIDDAELQNYKTKFLDESLRHTKYDYSDLLSDIACPAIVQEVYSTLLDVGSSSVLTDNSELSAKISCWVAEFARLKSALVLADKLLSQKANMSRDVTERDSQITDLNRVITERDGQIASLNQAVTERDSQITDLNRAITERDGQIVNLNQAVTERDSQITNLNQTLSSLFVSKSWRITAPLRSMRRFVQGMPKIILNRALVVYRRIPFSLRGRKRLKTVLFTVFGPLFRRTDAYQAWKAYRQVSTEWPSGQTLHMVSHPSAPIQFANGEWEWRDYKVVKERIVQLKQQQLAQVTPLPMAIFDIGDEVLQSVAAKISLPPVPSKPDISIILPVFNNLRVTLECLLSISENVEQEISFEVILADDASTDETAEILASVVNLRVVRNEQNLGFLRNCNNALRYVCGKYVVFLNNDVQVTKGWLTGLLEIFSTHTKVGAVGPKFVYPSGYLQEAGVAFQYDAAADMVGLNDDPARPRYNYIRRVDYISGACLMLPTDLIKQLGGFSEDFLPCYCEDSDLCLRVQAAGYYVYYNPASTVIHHLSKTTATFDPNFKHKSIAANLVKVQQKWSSYLDITSTPKIIAFYLPQFYPFPENDRWWGVGFTEWTNVTKTQPNFAGHYQPRLPADLGFYDLRLNKVMEQQAALAHRYGIHGFCFYYYWFGGKRLLEYPLEQMLAMNKPDMPFCLCWANENWSRRWDGNEQEILIAQTHSPEDDEAIISDLIRYFHDPRYIRIDGRPLILVYRVTLFPDFVATAARWRKICKEQGLGEIYITMVESMDLVHANRHPREFGCDAAVEFPPLEMAEQKSPSGEIINPEFTGAVADYRDITVRYAVRDFPGYTRFKGVMPGWDNTARRQNNGFCFEYATPGAFQAWLEESLEQTRQQHYGDERLVFINAWNEWAEGAYLEPDRRFGHAYLEAIKNAFDAPRLLRRGEYWHTKDKNRYE